MHSFWFARGLAFFANTFILINSSSALRIYTESTTLQRTSAASLHTVPTGSSSSSKPMGAYILQGLGTQASDVIATTPSLETHSPAINATGSSSSNTIYQSKKFWVGTLTSEFPLHHDIFTASPNASTAAQAISSAMQCWSEIVTWRNESASFRNAKIANRTWSLSTFWSSTTGTWLKTSTLYPSSVSTYKLCDGSPRADVRPKTTQFSGTTTFWANFTSTARPTFRSQPRSLEPDDCRVLYHDSNVAVKGEDELLRQCGNPAHLGESASCLIGGGPVELVYFPVERNNGSLCRNSSHNSSISAKPLIPGLSEITTLSRTFTSDSVYLSFKTLYATYDGFWDTIGPTFKDLILPFQSTDISTQCGGWFGAFGTGTQLDYADLNWPVPASAYKCQARCTVGLSSSATLLTPDPVLFWNIETTQPGPECSTIWSDVNPVLAIPTKIRGMVPEWSSCSFWNANLANFWFDPPIALQPAAVEAMPTMSSSLETTPAAPSSTPSSPLVQNTQATQAASSPAAIESSISSSTKPASSQAQLQTSDPTTMYDPSQYGENSQDSNDIMGVPSSHFDSSADPAATTTADPFTAQAGEDSTTQSVPAPSTADKAGPSQNDADPILSSVDPELASMPAFSVLTEALSSAALASSSDEFLTTDQSGEEDTTASFSVHPLPTTIISGVELTFGSEVATVFQASNSSILGTRTMAQGEATTIFGLEVSATAGGLVVGSSHVPISALPADPQTSGESVVELGSLTLTASVISDSPHAIVVGSQTLSAGGPVATISGQTVTQSSGGIALISDSQTIAFTAVPLAHGTDSVQNAASNGDVLPSVVFGSNPSKSTLVAGDLTITASAVSDSPGVFVIGSHTISSGGSAISTDGKTITFGSSGLVVAGSRTTEIFSAVPASPTASNSLDEGEVIYALGSLTVTASPISATSSTFDVGGTTLSQGGFATIISGATFTVGPNGLDLIDSQTTVPMSTLSPPDVSSLSGIPPSVMTRTSSVDEKLPSAVETATASTSTSAGMTCHDVERWQTIVCGLIVAVIGLT